jgi:hypothetical protein
MKKLLLAILLLLSSTVAAARDEWTTPQIVGEVTYLTLVAVDWRQTMDIRNHLEIREMNGALGSQPDNGRINRYFIATTAVQYVIANHLRSDWRDLWITGGVILEVDTVAGNKRIGLKTNIKF